MPKKNQLPASTIPSPGEISPQEFKDVLARYPSVVEAISSKKGGKINQYHSPPSVTLAGLQDPHALALPGSHALSDYVFPSQPNVGKKRSRSLINTAMMKLRSFSRAETD